MRCVFTSLILIALFSSAAFAQRSEVGFGIGTFNYTGDLVRSYNFSFSKPAATIFYRSNLSHIISWRTSITAGKIGASDKRPIDASAASRGASFNLFLLEASSVMEYHFMNWHDDKRVMRFTPYMFAGIGLFAISGNDTKPQGVEYSNVQAVIPFGLGFKYVLNPKWYVSLEFGMRKTFFDYLDNVSGSDDKTIPKVKNGNPSDNDHYYFLGLTLTHTFYTIPCPTSPYK